MQRITSVLTVSILVTAICLLEGCNIADSEKQAKANYTGTWKLIRSYDNSDSSYVDISWISLTSNSTFQSNTSFYWAKDTLRGKPLSGKWDIQIISSVIHNDEGEGTFIILKADSTSKSWKLSGNGRKDSTMYWHGQHSEWEYTWKLSN